MVPGKFSCVCSTCPVSCPAPSTSSELLLLCLDFQRKMHFFAQKPLGSSSAQLLPQSPWALWRAAPAGLTLGTSFKCSDNFFSPTETSMVRNPELMLSTAFQRAEILKSKGNESLFWEPKGEMFCLIRDWARYGSSAYKQQEGECRFGRQGAI